MVTGVEVPHFNVHNSNCAKTQPYCVGQSQVHSAYSGGSRKINSHVTELSFFFSFFFLGNYNDVIVYGKNII